MHCAHRVSQSVALAHALTNAASEAKSMQLVTEENIGVTAMGRAGGETGGWGELPIPAICGNPDLHPPGWRQVEGWMEGWGGAPTPSMAAAMHSFTNDLRGA